EPEAIEWYTGEDIAGREVDPDQGRARRWAVGRARGARDGGPCRPAGGRGEADDAARVQLLDRQGLRVDATEVRPSATGAGHQDIARPLGGDPARLDADRSVHRVRRRIDPNEGSEIRHGHPDMGIVCGHPARTTFEEGRAERDRGDDGAAVRVEPYDRPGPTVGGVVVRDPHGS